MKTLLLLIALILTLQTKAQDVLFAGPSIRLQSGAIGINTGIKKEIANFGTGGLIEVSFYPYKMSENEHINEFYLAYTDVVLGGYYNFYLPNETIIFPIAGFAINSVRAKAKVENITNLGNKPEAQYVKSQIQIGLGGFYGVGILKKVGRINLIGNIRHEFTNIGSLKIFVGLAYKFSRSPNDK